ncbi:hypothetical protein [Ureibacillus sinduriensis]|uniref:Uncharacterized protein n=1 Tax=Ureibacillus sinduriensis BLB-1 = JCM 15800 TaxID=1384057 RepID=A0A0A3IMT8_9BACL|nr:hypothetical protein [Ureibacillus sinduriensis]KGR76152.1 hypothetical protein CD33_08245 [Ureibacillus sinduriensis BLB-1 = JCM 15800]
MKKKLYIQTLAVTGFTAIGLFAGASHSFALENESSAKIGINEVISLENIGDSINDKLLKTTYSDVGNINLSPANLDVSINGKTSISSTVEETTGAESSSGNLNITNGLSAEKTDDGSSTDVSGANTIQVHKEASAAAVNTGVDLDITNNVDIESSSLKLDAASVELEEEMSSSRLDSGLSLAATNSEVVDSTSLNLDTKLDAASDVVLDQAGVSSSQLGSALNLEATNDEVGVSSLLNLDANSGALEQRFVSSSQQGTKFELGIMSNVDKNSSLTLNSDLEVTSEEQE